MNTIITSCSISVASQESPAVLLIGRVRMKFGSHSGERTSMCSQAHVEILIIHVHNLYNLSIMD